MFKKSHDHTDSFWYNAFGPTVGAVIVFLIEVGQIVAISVAIIIPVRVFLIQPFLVQGASMEPTFYDREYLIIDELSYRFHEPERGDVVVFRYPRDPSQHFIKRVIGIPGETVEVTDGKVIIYNDENPVGIEIKEDYIASLATAGKRRVELNPEEYFVMGDNRDFSLDSRTFGPIGNGNIVGRVWFRGFPLSRITGFQNPEYNI